MMKQQSNSTSNKVLSIDAADTPEAHLDEVRCRVTRSFCIFCFGLSVFAIVGTFFAEDVHTQVINAVAMVLYCIPLFFALKKFDYRITAKLLIVIAVSVVLANAVSSNCDLSPVTIVWYFVYLVFAHTVLDLRWAIGIAVVGFVTVVIFSILHLTGNQYINEDLLEDSVLAGAPVATAVAFISLIYLLSVYKKLRHELLDRVMTSDRQKSQLVGVMSHDLRNYIGAVQGISSLMAEDVDGCGSGDVKKKMMDSIELVDQAAAGALQLVEEVVSAARETTEQEMFLEDLDLLHFIAPIFQRYKVLARTKGIQVSLHAGADIVIASINRDRFSRVIENLLSNALKFTNEHDTVTISIDRLASGPVVTIADTGIGIPENLHAAIFEPFTKAGRRGTGNEKSIGLGLSIVKKTVERHGGTIQFESEEGKGTVFTITLPQPGEGT